MLRAACSRAGVGRPSDSREGVLLLGVRAPDEAGDWGTSMVRDQVRNRDSDGARIGAARLGRRDNYGVFEGVPDMCRERVDVCWYGPLLSGLGFRAAFREDGFSPFVRCHSLPGLDASFLVVHAVLFFEVELVVVRGLLGFLLLPEELELFGRRVEVVDVGNGAVEVAVLVSGVGGRGAPRMVGGRVLKPECGETGFAAFEREGIQKEGDVYRELHNAQVANIPTLSRAGDVPSSRDDTTTALFAAQRTRTHEYVNGSGFGHGWCPGRPDVEPYIHYRLVLETLGRPLNFPSSRLDNFAKLFEMLS